MSQINEINFNKDFQLHPNPALDRVTIECPSGQAYTISIFNMLGVLVLKQEFDTNHNEIDIAALTKGIYVVRLADLGGNPYSNQILLSVL
jgi:hypothetical protein